MFGLKEFSKEGNAALLGTESSPVSTKAWINGLGVAAVEQIAARHTHRLGHRGIH